MKRSASLITAGLILVGVGTLIVSAPRGLAFGVVCIAIGAVGIVVTVVVALRLWRTGRWVVEPVQARRRRVTREGAVGWLLERVKVVFALSCVFAAAGVIEPLLFHQDGWWRLWSFGPIAVVSGVVWLVLRRRSVHEPASAPDTRA